MYMYTADPQVYYTSKDTVSSCTWANHHMPSVSSRLAVSVMDVQGVTKPTDVNPFQSKGRKKKNIYIYIYPVLYIYTSGLTHEIHGPNMFIPCACSIYKHL